MKNKPMLKIMAFMAEKAIIKSNGTHCLVWSYQPDVPAGIRYFGKRIKSK